MTKAMERDDLQTAHELLDRTDDLLCGETSPCLDEECSRSALGTINKARLMLDLYSGLLNKFATSSMSSDSETNQGEGFDPSEAERSLGPLANAHRLTIMDLLSSGGRPLSEIGKCLEMPTGHLQFHMRALKEADYVGSDRRSRIYSLTPKGRKALGAVRELVGKVSLSDSAHPVRDNHNHTPSTILHHEQIDGEDGRVRRRKTSKERPCPCRT